MRLVVCGDEWGIVAPDEDVDVDEQAVYVRDGVMNHEGELGDDDDVLGLKLVTGSHPGWHFDSGTEPHQVE